MSTATARNSSSQLNALLRRREGADAATGESQAEQPRSRSSRPARDPSASGEFRIGRWGNPRLSTVLETAAACFSRRGFSATTLAEIGTELGRAKSIIHYYFSSKTALVHEVQRLTYRRYRDLLVAALNEQERPAQTPTKGQPAVEKRLWSKLSADPSVRGLTIELWAECRRDPELSSVASALADEARALLTERLAERVGQRLDPEALATLTLAILDGLTVLAEREGNVRRANLAYAAYLKLLACPG